MGSRIGSERMSSKPVMEEREGRKEGQKEKEERKRKRKVLEKYYVVYH